MRELVEQVNKDPRCGSGHATSQPRSVLMISSGQFGQNKATPQTRFQAKVTRVILRNNANLSTGGSATDVTDDAHPEVAARAAAAAQMVGLDICGVDLVADSVLKPIEDQMAASLKSMRRPALRMHLSPLWQRPRGW